jgi:hypothetical protein
MDITQCHGAAGDSPWDRICWPEEAFPSYPLPMLPCPHHLPALADVLCVSAMQDVDDEELSQKRNWCVNQPTAAIYREVLYLVPVVTKVICNM